MDGLSVAANILAVLGLAAKSGEMAVKYMIQAKNAPAEFRSLIDDVSRFISWFHQLEAIVGSQEWQKNSSSSSRLLESLLNDTKKAFDNLRHYVGRTVSQSEDPSKVERYRWPLHERTIAKYRRSLYKLREDIIAVLRNHDMERNIEHGNQLRKIGVELQQVKLLTQQQQVQNSVTYEQVNQLHTVYQQWCQRIEDASVETRARLETLIGRFREPATEQSKWAKIYTPSRCDMVKSPSIVERASGHDVVELTCSKQILETENCACFCPCHQQKITNSPRYAQKLIGNLTIYTSELNFAESSCDKCDCSRSQSKSTVIVYSLPAWFARDVVICARYTQVSSRDVALSFKKIAAKDIPNAEDHEYASQRLQQVTPLSDRGSLRYVGGPMDNERKSKPPVPALNTGLRHVVINRSATRIGKTLQFGNRILDDLLEKFEIALIHSFHFIPGRAPYEAARCHAISKQNESEINKNFKYLKIHSPNDNFRGSSSGNSTPGNGDNDAPRQLEYDLPLFCSTQGEFTYSC